MRVRAVFDNPDLVIQPVLFGIINIPRSLPYEGVLIPDSAISADQDRRIVYRVDGEGKVSPQQIRPGRRLHVYRVVRHGLTGEVTIVIHGLTPVLPRVNLTPELNALPHV